MLQDYDEAKVRIPSKTRNSPVISCKIQRGAKNSNNAPEFVIKPAYNADIAKLAGTQ